MKYITLIISIILLAGCTSRVPKSSQNMTVQIDFSADSRSWKQCHVYETSKRSYTEYGLQEEEGNPWTEKVGHDVDYTDKTVNEYITEYEQMAPLATPPIIFNKHVNKDGATTLVYRGDSEAGILKFIQGTGCVYRVSYSAKNNSADSFELWSEIVGNTKLSTK